MKQEKTFLSMISQYLTKGGSFKKSLQWKLLRWPDGSRFHVLSVRSDQLSGFYYQSAADKRSRAFITMLPNKHYLVLEVFERGIL